MNFNFETLCAQNTFVSDLVSQGYAVDLVSSYLIIYGVPVMDRGGEIQYGDIASPLTLGKDGRIGKPTTHQVWFRGVTPHGLNGDPLPVSSRRNPRKVGDQEFPNSFSMKVGRKPYPDEQSKISAYLDFIAAPAISKGAAPRQALYTAAAEIESPLLIPDSLSARDGTSDLAQKMHGLKVAIVGTGGTGSYILDSIAKTHLGLIRLYDSDRVEIHTLFRMPGAVDESALGEFKVDVLHSIYSGFHSNIEPVAEKVTPSNIETLSEMDFVFISIDDGPSRGLISRFLYKNRVPFIDVGMGLYRGSSGLDGMLRVVECEPSLPFPSSRLVPDQETPDKEYRRNPQIAELNALNAALAVLRFKQRFGIFAGPSNTVGTLLEIGTLELDIENE